MLSIDMHDCNFVCSTEEATSCRLTTAVNYYIMTREVRDVVMSHNVLSWRFSGASWYRLQLLLHSDGSSLHNVRILMYI